MTHPTTELNIRERLARIAAAEFFKTTMAGGSGVASQLWVDRHWWQFEPGLDAILAALQEPSEGMLGAAVRSTMDYPDSVREATCWVLLSDNGLNAKAMVKPWQAVIQHIRDGGQ